MRITAVVDERSDTELHAALDIGAPPRFGRITPA